MQFYHSTSFKLPLPPKHRFPMEKYTLLYQRVVELFGSDDVFDAPTVDNTQLLQAHDEDYLTGVINGTLPQAQLRRIGFPWSQQMIERSRRSTGATLAAAHAALRLGRGANLAGGTHHARRYQGGGYCVFNDSAVTLKVLEAEGKITRGLVIDLDVHQGDGTAHILGPDPAHFCFSMHGAKNYPFKKEQSDLDVALNDGTSDDEYLDLLDKHLPLVFDQARPDLVIYLAGADPYQEDQLGRLHLSKAGLAVRDSLVLETCDYFGLPVVITMGGGYAKDIKDIVDIHSNTLLIANGLPPTLTIEP